MTSATKDQIKSIVERVENLLEQRKEISTDISEVYSEAKSNGFNVKALKRVVSERSKDLETRAEEIDLYEIYADAVGLLV